MEEKEKQETIKYTSDFAGNPPIDAAQLAALEGRSQRSWKEGFVRKNKKQLAIVGAVVLLAAGAWIWQAARSKTNTATDLQKNEVEVKIPEGSDHVFVNDVSGPSVSKTETEAEGSDAIEKNETGSMGSESFRLKEVTFGTGSVALYSAETENDPLSITDVHSEVMSGNNENNVKLLVTWKTDKLAKAVVKYDKGGASRTLAEGGYGFSHALVLSNLERATRYTFNIVGSDRWGNTATSDTFNAYIGKKSASVFELIAQEFSKMFGWANKK
jgi:hypothetical protein